MDAIEVLGGDRFLSEIKTTVRLAAPAHSSITRLGRRRRFAADASVDPSRDDWFKPYNDRIHPTHTVVTNNFAMM